MKKYILLILCFTLVGCSWNSHTGLWGNNKGEKGNNQEKASMSELASPEKGSQATLKIRQNPSEHTEDISENTPEKDLTIIDINTEIEGSTPEREPLDIEYREDGERVFQLSDFPTPSKAWKSKFSLKKPTTGFVTIFFNTDTKEQSSEFNTDILFFSDESDQVSTAMGEVFTDYSHDDEGEVSIYSIGTLDISETGKYDFSITTSGETRLILDGKLIHSGEGMRTIFLEAGKYTLEMEHINTAWYLDVFVNHELHSPVYTISELKKTLSPQSGDIWYTGVYESYGNENEMELIVDKKSKNASLILGSYEPVVWNINNSKGANIREILIYSFEFGSTVTGDIEGIPVYKISRNVNVEMDIYEVLPQCDDHGGYFYCEGGINDFDNLNDVVNDIFGKKLTGFTGDYSEGPLEIPGRVLNASEYKRIQKEKEELLEFKRKAEEEKNFNNIFED